MDQKLITVMLMMCQWGQVLYIKTKWWAQITKWKVQWTHNTQKSDRQKDKENLFKHF